MNEELYSYDKYQGHRIFIVLDNHKYYAEIQWNGTTVKSLSSMNPERLLTDCKLWIDENGE